MKTLLRFGIAALALASCRINDDRPNAILVAEVNSLTLATDDTLTIGRSLTNTAPEGVWLNVSVPAYSLTNGQGQEVCVDGTLDQSDVELIRIPPNSNIFDERSFALADLENCVPGTYTLVISATFRQVQTGPDAFTLRTSPAQFVLTAP